MHQVGDLFELNVKLRCQKVNLKTALHVSGVFTTHPQEHKATASTASGKHYTVIERVKFLIKSADRLD
jgi:hypothetical protein